MVIRDGEYLALRGREEVFARRRQRQANTRRLRRKAEQCGRVISHLPFVRMVAITGSIAADNAAEGADLDFMIVTAPGRVWTVRALSMVVVRFWSLRGVTVCPNYLLAESALALPERDRYTARELLQMLPVGASHAYERMLRENEWWRDFLPNATPRAHARPAKLTLGRRIIEGMMSTELFDLAERWLMRRKASELRGQATTTEAVFSAEMCKGNFENWRARTEQATAERLKALLERKS